MFLMFVFLWPPPKIWGYFFQKDPFSFGFRFLSNIMVDYLLLGLIMALNFRAITVMAMFRISQCQDGVNVRRSYNCRC